MVRKHHNSWWIDFGHRGRRYRYRSPDNTRAGALAYELQLRAKIAKGDAPRLTPRFVDFAEEWFRTHVTANNKASTRVLTRGILDRHLIPAFGHLLLSDIGPESIEKYKASRTEYGLSAKGVNNHLGVLGKCLRSAVEWERIVKAPKITLLKRPPQKFDFLETHEGDLLLRAFEDRSWRTMALMALRTGMRLGELTGLRWEDVDFRRGLLVVSRSISRGVIEAPKNWKSRDIPLSGELVRALMAMPAKTGYVFHRGGEPVTRGMAWAALKTACLKSGLGRLVGWHVLRHSFASQLAMAGVPLKAVSELLGHSTIAMTEKYAHLSPSSKVAAVRLLDATERHQAVTTKIETVEITGEKTAEKEPA